MTGDAREKAQTEMQRQLQDARTGALAKYMDMFVGRRSLWALLKYEFVTMLAARRAGALGLLLRKKLYPRLLKKCGRGVVFGRDVVLRCPNRIEIGENVIVDDGVVLDARGAGEEGLVIASGVFLGRDTVLSCKAAPISVGENTNLGAGCLVQAESPVRIGRDVLFASYCYLVGGGNHGFDRTDLPIIQQPSVKKGGIAIGDGSWLGARVTVLDGANVGEGCVLGAGAVVTKPLDAWSVAVGVPAKALRNRKD